MLNDPRMSSRGRLVALALGVLIALALPKRVEHGSSGARCVAYEIKPLGFYLLGIDVAYSTGEDCR
jgi:hypothetical protein